MTGQISTLPVELVAVVVAASMVAGAVDIVRQPGWAWTRADESKPAYLILDLLLPVIGLAMYAFRARPKVTAAVAAGATPTLVAEPQPQPTTVSETAPTEPTVTATVVAESNPFTGFREVAGGGGLRTDASPVPDEPEQFEVSSTFFSTGAANRTMRHPLALARAYRPKQRTSLVESEPRGEPESVPAPASIPEPIQVAVPEPEPVQAPAPVPEPVQAGPEPEPEPVPTVEAEPPRVTLIAQDAPTVPSGWKADPTGRHQFRYWDGSYWTENVADDGEESRDALSA